MPTNPEDAKAVQDCLVECMDAVRYIQKDGTNEHHRYTYATAAAVFSKVNPILVKHGVAIRSQVKAETSTRKNAKGQDVGHAVVTISLAFCKGDYMHHVEGAGEGQDSGDKAVMKANTAALKYALSNAFLISWGDDPEADAKTDEDTKVETPRVNRRKSTPIVATYKPSLLEEIQEAQSIQILETLKRRILEQRGTAEYDTLVATYKAKEQTVKPEGAPNGKE